MPISEIGAFKLNRKHYRMKIIRMEMRFFLLFLILSLAPCTVSGDSDFSNFSEQIMDKLSFGKAWYVYIEAYFFDILLSAICKDINCDDINFALVSEYLALLNHLAILKYPCQGVNISTVGKRGFGNIYSKDFEQEKVQFDTRSALCGNITTIYGFHPGSTKDDYYIDWFWQIHVNAKFIINITCLSLESKFQSSCIATRALIEEIREYDHKYLNRRIVGSFCPDNQPQSFYSTNNAVGIYLLSSTAFQGLFRTNSYFNEWVGTVSFIYQIHDRSDWTFDPLAVGSYHAYPERIYDYRFPVHQQVDVNSHLYQDMKNQSLQLPVHVSDTMRRNTLLLDNVPYLSHVFESQNRIVYFLYFQSFLGVIIAVTEGALECDISAASLVIYEGPLLDINMMDDLLLRLQEWSCSHIVNATDYATEIKGRIGDMTIVIFVDKIKYFHLLLIVELRDIEWNSSAVVLQQIFHLMGTPITTYLDQNGTFLYSLDIYTKSDAWVSITFERLSFEGYVDSACRYGGIFLRKDFRPHWPGSVHVGALCSSKAARQFSHLYGHRGLTLHGRVTIYIKQYTFLSRLSAKLRFSLDRCFTAINWKPIHLKTGPAVYALKYAQSMKEKRYYNLGTNSYYRWKTIHSFIGIKRQINIPCVKLEYIFFSSFHIDKLPYNLNQSKSGLAVGHVENVKPSRISVAFWTVNDTVRPFYSCLANALRVFPDNRNNEPFIYVNKPEGHIWSTTSFAVKIGLDMVCILLDGSFFIQMEDGSDSPESFSEIGGYQYDREHPIMPQGVWGSVNVVLNVGAKFTRISFQRPSFNPRCCYIDTLDKIR